ncbi:hypothetical protein FQR65_LT03526 [Abscondita terminalis]|nr:hypothetical protein FQR65_LT03526 [Abscondita terminalis]
MIKQEDVSKDSISNLKLEFPSEEAPSITDNPVACNNCKEQQTESDRHFIKKEFVDESDVIIKDESLIFNTDLFLCIEESIHTNLYYCYECNYTTNDKNNLTEHIVAHLLKCDRCDFSTFDNSSLIAHIQVHSSLGEHIVEDFSTLKNECCYCDYRTNSKNALKFHAKGTFTKQLEIIKCDECVYSTSSPKYFNRHILRQHRDRGNTFKCDLCDYRSTTYRFLKIHTLKHSNSVPFYCDECDYKTYNKQNLKRHTFVHSQEKPLKCNLCDYSCITSTSLKMHVLNHASELHSVVIYVNSKRTPKRS